jgi:hypothetical protein
LLSFFSHQKRPTLIKGRKKKYLTVHSAFPFAFPPCLAYFQNTGPFVHIETTARQTQQKQRPAQCRRGWAGITDGAEEEEEEEEEGWVIDMWKVTCEFHLLSVKKANQTKNVRWT